VGADGGHHVLVDELSMSASRHEAGWGPRRRTTSGPTSVTRSVAASQWRWRWRWGRGGGGGGGGVGVHERPRGLSLGSGGRFRPFRYDLPSNSGHVGGRGRSGTPKPTRVVRVVERLPRSSSEGC
jgi:hypothetical protein